MKNTNPKNSAGSSKLPLHLWPPTATAMGSIAMLNGKLKYGRSNYLVDGALASVYIAALKRHIDLYYSGEDYDAEGVPHLASILSTAAILVDAMYAGVLVDDRMVTNGYDAAVEHLTGVADGVRELHAGKNPKHYSRLDNE